MPDPPDKPNRDRYIARSLDDGWCVWDARRNVPVFETEGLRADQARVAGRDQLGEQLGGNFPSVVGGS